MNVILSPEAEEDLEQIADFIARDDGRRAMSFVGELVESALDLSVFPERFPLVPSLASHGIRRRRHGNYLILYRSEARRVTVLRVLHAHREYEALLLPKA